MVNKINVKSEFGTLKRVVVAQSEFIFPTEPKSSGLLTSDIIKEVKGARGKSYEDVFKEKDVQWKKEREDLISVLKKYDVEVLRPRLLTDFEKSMNKKDGCANFFVRDTFITIGNMIIESSMKPAYRRYEVLPARDLIMNEAYKSKAMYISVPEADISDGYDSKKGPFLEGGDIIIYDNHVLVGISGVATDKSGYMWLKNLIEPMGYKVIEVPLKSDILHLDCAISLVRDGLMIINEEAFINGVPEIFKTWDKISVSNKDVQSILVNGLSISERVHITDIACKDTIGTELEKRGITVEYIDFKISRSMGGAFRCSTQALLRE